ncbi:aminopeptidase N [Aliidiomarina iranensis]|uniref:Aminopeptidase N n=1 Tax=Aliidiomarina iranensis TaxID=1434071 RepID=A0A432W051_9GAMM|nr:aminopeptidase N [Aliidiomarina iranensis]RUO22400.1 aminopeptidase N [Aliidiomarina iranensis]
MSHSPEAKYRLNYSAPNFKIHTTELNFHLDDHHTEVLNRMDIECLTEGASLELDGENLQLVALAINGRVLSEDEYSQTDKQLIIPNVPERFELVVETLIDPAGNTSLEGLYKSAGTFCTQCEAEGFRKITYYLDRPDVLSVFTTTVNATKAEHPYLLANGNPTAEHQSGERHAVTWHDPHPKPAYLFALVAGDFDLLEDSFTTQENREVLLQVFVDKGNLPRAKHAMASLINAMKWDETRFNLTYDLDIYMIVAVDFFNMGAMENKGLNIFNSKYVLADSSTATDQDFLNVESVIGHEYFHNWTGNRITCRDWFQLSLKEGLTVFRDQEFSADLGMRAVNRIQDARIIRTHQFEEDAGPMAHPIRPDRVVEMNNFYTVTVYNKGAEVIRMLHTLLGESKFQQGMALYVQRHDGEAVTCEDFVKAMEDASGLDLVQFRNWYSQAGTPRVTVTETYNAENQTYLLTLTQSTPATPGQQVKHPFHIPLRVEFVSNSGEPMALHLLGADKPTTILELREQQQVFEFHNVNEKPVTGLLADFSAPIRLEFTRPETEYLAIIAGGNDPFLRWDAVQQLYFGALHTAVADNSAVALTPALIAVLQKALADENSDPAMNALLLQVPSEEALSQEYDIIPVEAICRAVSELRLALAKSLQSELMQAWQQVDLGSNALNSSTIAKRMLGNTALSFLALLPEDASIQRALKAQFKAANNMTLQFGALQAAVHANHPIASELLTDFAGQWQGETLVMDKWLAAQATAPISGTVSKIQKLTEHSAFNWGNPNRIYSLLASFTHNLGQLHHSSGAGYEFMIAAIKRLNASNPQVASRLLSPLLKWRRLPENQQAMLKSQLVSLSKLPNLAPDLYEKVNQTLTDN